LPATFPCLRSGTAWSCAPTGVRSSITSLQGRRHRDTAHGRRNDHAGFTRDTHRDGEVLRALAAGTVPGAAQHWTLRPTVPGTGRSMSLTQRTVSSGALDLPVLRTPCQGAGSRKASPGVDRQVRCHRAAAVAGPPWPTPPFAPPAGVAPLEAESLARSFGPVRAADGALPVMRRGGVPDLVGGAGCGRFHARAAAAVAGCRGRAAAVQRGTGAVPSVPPLPPDFRHLASGAARLQRLREEQVFDPLGPLVPRRVHGSRLTGMVASNTAEHPGSLASRQKLRLMRAIKFLSGC